MRYIVRMVTLALLVAGLVPTPAAAAATSVQRSVPNGRILSFSPDGKWLLAEHPLPAEAGATGGIRASLQDDLDVDEPKLCVYAVPSLAPRSCTAPGVFGGDADPKFIAGAVSWAPDGESLAFSDGSVQVLADGDIWLLHTATGELTDLTDDSFSGTIPFEMTRSDPAYIDTQPSFSPDGAEIAFSRTIFAADQRSEPSIALLDLATSAVSTIAQPGNDPYREIQGNVAWSPDQDRVYFTTSGIDVSLTALWSATLDGSTVAQITSPFNERGFQIILDEISPDGDAALVFITKSLLRIKPPYYALVDLQSGALTPLAPTGPEIFVYSLTFDPDGNLLMAEEHPAEGDADDSVNLVRLDPKASIQTPLAGNLPSLEFNPLQTDVTALPNDQIAFPNSSDGETYSWTLVSLNGPDIAAATPEATPQFAPGQTVFTTDATTLRSTPSTQGAIAAALDAGAELVIVDHAVEIDGIVWWPVRDPATGAIGYIPAALLSVES